jgi:adenosine kinase
MLNVAFLTPRLKREFGGCAANIAYTLKALGGTPTILATVGQDGQPYLERLASLGIDVSVVRLLPETWTAQAFITTDLADNQITAFHPGAMNEAHEVSAQGMTAAFGIVAPNGKLAMQTHARQFAADGVPYLFDPGQGLPMFDGAELRELIGAAAAVTVNDYEASMLVERTGWSEAEIAGRVQALVVTRGAEGCQVWQGDRCDTVAAAPIGEAKDPTGCGDAFRGGLLYGLSQGWDWIRAARLGSVMGAIKIESQGAQNHQISRAGVAARHEQAFGVRPWQD